MNTEEVRPKLSIIVVIYNMKREAPRTLRSLSCGYQKNVTPEDYEVIVVDNGSKPEEAINNEIVTSFGPNFVYCSLGADAQPSPAYAVNAGVSHSRGEFVAVMIDGARLASPGLVHSACVAAKTYKRSVIATLSWHLGPTSQQDSIKNGYNQEVEDSLLAKIDWPNGDAYRLFEISALGHSARDGIFHTPGESNFLVMSRLLFDELQGYDENFNLPGGGLVNQDMFARACSLSDTEVIVLLGEGTFHQLHGGISTNDTDVKNYCILSTSWHEQYHNLRGKPFAKSKRIPKLWGSFAPSIFPQMMRLISNS